MGKNLTKLSKFLAIILRHKPDEFGVLLDEQGFAPIEIIWDKVVERFGTVYDLDDLDIVVTSDARGKKRYEIVNDKIRALYGHSNPDIHYEAIIPPMTLYHGTNATALKKIQREGLQALSRQYVHMTTNIDNAIHVAKRKTRRPILLKIRALDAYESGIIFHQAEDEHYLARMIPIQFIEIQE